MANATDSLTVLPKYQAIVDRLIGEIEQGHYAPGDRLPSEAQLSRDFAVSLGTLQKALALLAPLFAEGTVDRLLLGLDFPQRPPFGQDREVSAFHVASDGLIEL